MNREIALENFLRSLKVTLNHASIYFKEHPLFLKSINDLAEKTHELLPFLDPLIIGIAPGGLLIDGVMHESGKNVAYGKVKLYVELGKFFHYRKIKSIQIIAGVTTEELAFLVRSLSLSSKDVLKAGGIRQVLAAGNVTHCIVEELDYSLFLKGEGTEVKELWTYLLSNAIEKNDSALIAEFTANFKSLTDKVRVKEFIEDADLRESVDKFLQHLKIQDPANFRKCMKELMRAVIRDKSVAQDEKAALLKSFFKDITSTDSTEALLDEIILNENFDSLNLRLFTSLIDKTQHTDVVAQLIQNLGPRIKESPRLGRKIQELFRLSVATDLPQVYLDALSSFTQGSSVGERELDRESIHTNYQLMLLNLLVQERLPDRLKVVLGKIITEWEYIAKRKDIQYLKSVILVLEKKQEEIPDKIIFEDINRHITHFTESLVLGEVDSTDFFYFVAMLRAPTNDVHFYLERIFIEKKINPYILALVFRFYSQYLPLVQKNIREQYSNVGLLKKLIENLKIVDVPASMQTLKYIFMYGNNFIKVEALRAIRHLSHVDNDFLFSILIASDYFIKKEAFEVLARNESTCRKAIAMLLLQASPFGLKNGLLRENIDIVQAFSATHAKEYLLALANRKFIWNRSLREAARKALGDS